VKKKYTSESFKYFLRLCLFFLLDLLISLLKFLGVHGRTILQLCGRSARAAAMVLITRKP
jgi:hypothetical protein